MTLDKHTDESLKIIFQTPVASIYNDAPPPAAPGMDDDGLQYDSGYDSDGAELNRLTGHWGYGRPQVSKQAKDTLAFAKVAPLDFKNPPLVTRPAPRS